MLNYLLSYLQFGNRFCGIEHTSFDDNDSIHAVLLKKNKKEIDIEESLEAKSVEGLAKKLPKNQHAFLVINDNNILSKSLKSNQDDALKLVSMVFPNIKLNEFYYEIVHQGNNHFIAISRKSQIDDIVKKYIENGISIIDFSLGNSMISSISKYIKSDEIWTSSSNISLENGLITAIKKTNEKKNVIYDVNGIKVENDYLFSLAGALSSLIDNHEPNTNFESEKNRLSNAFKQLHFFRQFLKFGLIFILGMLLINFFLFNNYFNKVSTLQQTAQFNQATKNNVVTLNESVLKIEKMVEDMKNSNSSKTSFYTNEIVQSLPNSILLKEFNYQPLLKRIKTDQLISINKNTLVVSGTSNDSDSFSNWLTAIEEYVWVSKIDILEYGSESVRTSDFSIKITLNVN